MYKGDRSRKIEVIDELIGEDWDRVDNEDDRNELIEFDLIEN